MNKENVCVYEKEQLFRCIDIHSNLHAPTGDHATKNESRQAH